MRATHSSRPTIFFARNKIFFPHNKILFAPNKILFAHNKILFVHNKIFFAHNKNKQTKSWPAGWPVDASYTCGLQMPVIHAGYKCRLYRCRLCRLL